MMAVQTVQPETQTLSQTASPEPKRRPRIVAIDIVRGYAMLMMLISHSAWTLRDLSFDISFAWSRPDLPPTPLTTLDQWIGLVLHLSTPTFFVLAGFSVSLFVASRERRGWTQWQISRYLLIRGAVLIGFDWLVLAWNPYAMAYTPIAHAVLTGIGVSLWGMAFMRRLSLRWLAVTALILTAGTQVIYHTTTPPTDANILRSVFLYLTAGDTVTIGMPVLAWLPVIMLGYISGMVIQQRPEQVQQFTLRMSLALFGVWLAVVGVNDFGRLYTAYPLVFSRNPPSLAYLSFYLGFTFLLLHLHTRFPSINESAPARLLKTLGQAAFFFFIMHGYILFIFAILLHFVTLPALLKSALITLPSLAVLTFLCAKHRALRRRYPDSPLKYL